MRSAWPFLFLLLIRTSFSVIHTNTAKETTLIPLLNDPSVLRFGKSATTDYYRLLDLDGDHLLIGARDVVYNISISSFAEVQSIKWPSKKEVVDECIMKGRSQDECHNFVRVLAKDDGAGVLICGTNSFEPMCRQYEREKYGEYRQSFEFPGLGLSPYDPNYNSTFLRDGDMLYAGTVSDFSGADPLIHRRNVTRIVDLGIRTGRNDAKFLNEPQFAGSFKDDKYAYLWFREQAGESECCERAVYSRVARLCRSDGGGPRSYASEWTSFVKARLNCSIPGEYPFYFDQIEAIGRPVSGRYSVREEYAKLVYAVFGSPLAGISSSAICAFDLSHITKVFEKSAYHSDGGNRHPTWMREESVSKYRPGTCVEDSRKLPEETVAFARTNLLMEDPVQNYFGAPLSIHSGSDRFTQISIDAQVRALDGRFYDIIFVGTDRGNVFKLVNLAGAGAKTSSPSHHIYTMQITNEPIRNMMLYKSDKLVYVDNAENTESFLIVVSDGSVARVPPSQCSRFSSCFECIELRDPHCAWDSGTNRCIRINEKSGSIGKLKQDIVEGRAEHVCEASSSKHPGGSAGTDQADPRQDFLALSSTTPNNCSCDRKKSAEACAPDTGSATSGVSSVSESTASVGGSTAIVLISVGIGTLGIVFGFFIGCLYSYWKTPSKENSSLLQGSFMQSPLQPVYSGNFQRRSPNQSPTNVINAYACTPKFNGTVPSSVSPVSLEVEDTEKPDAKMAWGTSTLPKDYRVKQMYL